MRLGLCEGLAESCRVSPSRFVGLLVVKMPQLCIEEPVHISLHSKPPIRGVCLYTHISVNQTFASLRAFTSLTFFWLHGNLSPTANYLQPTILHAIPRTVQHSLYRAS